MVIRELTVYNESIKIDGIKSPLRYNTDGMSDALCTYGLFKKYYTENHYFPSGGKWFEARDGSSYYQPDICRYEKVNMTNMELGVCFRRTNITSVVMMGDSNVMRYYKTLVRMLTGSSGSQCNVTDQESHDLQFTPDVPYFARSRGSWTKYLQSNLRHCAKCRGIQTECNMQLKSGEHRVLLESIASTNILDDSVQLQISNYTEVKPDIYWALTSQELVLRYFLNGRYPDIFIIFLPFNHAKLMNSDRIKLDIKYFKGLVDMYIPKSTKIFYMTTPGEFEGRRKLKIWKRRKFEKMLATEKINKLNHVLYDAVEGDLLSDGRTFGFYDLLEASRTRGNWSVDGVHMDDIWYERVNQRFWQTYCNSI